MKNYVLGALMCGMLIVSSPTTASANTNDQQLREHLIQMVALLQQQLTLLLAERENATNQVSVGDRIEVEDVENIQNEYNITNGIAISRNGQNITVDHAKYWQLVTQIIPSRYLNEHVGEFLVYDDEDDYTDAFVETLYRGSNKVWRLGINVGNEDNTIGDIADYQLLVHEFAHIVSLNNTQVQKVSRCSTFLIPEGCPIEGSYFKSHIDEFWDDALVDLVIEAEQSDDPEEAINEYYQEYEDEFITEYAATNPAEDWAETFAFFVVEDKPTGSSVADEKIRSLYDFPELVTLRNEIRSAVSY